MADSESPQNLYAKNLHQLFGYPLRYPEPKPGLPPSYAENGLHIGDVGYVDGEGMFEVLFNICFPPDHDLHRDLPDPARLVGLTEFKLNNAPPIPNAFPSGRVICHGCQGSHGDILDHNQSAPCKFISCSASALDWCQFADRKSLYLITGFYKTRSWRLASFHNVRPTGQVLLECNYAGGYTWHSGCDYRKSEENNNENQTVLISGFKIEVRGWGNHTVVERLPTYSRGIWSELESFLILLVSFWRWIVSIIMLKLRVHVQHVPALSQPFHPSDIINRYKLDKNPNVPVVITHDSEWLSMLKKNGLSHEDMLDEGRFLVFLEEKYTGDLDADNVVYLQRKIDDPRNSIPSPKTFFITIVPDSIRQFITCVRVENIDTGLKRMPFGFCVLIQFNSAKERKICRLASLCNSVIEWDDEIMLPADLTVKVKFSIVASFQFDPMLGNGVPLCVLETSVGDLIAGKTTYPLPSSRRVKDTSFCPSLLVTLEERRFDSFIDWSPGDNKSEYEDCLRIKVEEETDKGQKALLCYQKGEGTEKLKEYLQSFKLALDLCPPNHECRAAALFNYATAMLQIRGTNSDINVAITAFREVLGLHPAPHPSRPGTLLHLAQILLYRHGKLQYKVSVPSEIEELATEVRRACSSGSHECRAADLVVQTLRRYQIVTSGELAELDKLISELDRSAQIPPDGHFDRPHRLLNLSAALDGRFDITGSPHYLEKSISVMMDAIRLVSDDHFEKPWMLTFLGNGLVQRFMEHYDVTDLENSISMIEDAAKLVQDGHFDKPWMLASLGQALFARYLFHDDFADLESSISMFQNAVRLAPDDHAHKLWMQNWLDYLRYDAWCYSRWMDCELAIHVRTNMKEGEDEDEDEEGDEKNEERMVEDQHPNVDSSGGHLPTTVGGPSHCRISRVARED